MKISIEYEASWRNSFLDGDNNSKLPPGGREYLGSMTTLKKDDNFIQRDVTLDTVMGLLNRLIGDQRKLYQARNSKDYYFEDLESKVSFEDKPLLTNEIVYVRNMNGSTDQKSFSGVIKTNDPMLTSDYSNMFWGVLALNLDELCDFISDESFEVEKSIELDPLVLIERLDFIQKEKSIVTNEKLVVAKNILEKHFPLDESGKNGFKPFNKKNEFISMPFYCSALYLQMKRLSNRFDMSSAKAARGGITGISHNGFTVKNIMDRFTTGGQKILWGNPYIKKEKVKGQGEVISMLTKASGQLEISIDVDQRKGQEIKELIENAGVSAFYLGKKGLAYVSKPIRV